MSVIGFHRMLVHVLCVLSQKIVCCPMYFFVYDDHYIDLFISHILACLYIRYCQSFSLEFQNQNLIGQDWCFVLIIILMVYQSLFICIRFLFQCFNSYLVQPSIECTVHMISFWSPHVYHPRLPWSACALNGYTSLKSARANKCPFHIVQRT